MVLPPRRSVIVRIFSFGYFPHADLQNSALAASFRISAVGSFHEIKTPFASFSRSMTPQRSLTSVGPV